MGHQSDKSNLPRTLALIDDDVVFGEALAQVLRDMGVEVVHFADSNDLIADERLYDFDFYVVDLMLPGIDGDDLIKVLRRRTQAGVVAISGKHDPNVFRDVVAAGADMYLIKPVALDQVVIAITAVQRRAAAATPSAQDTWELDMRARALVAPDGVRVPLSDADLVVMECLAQAAGQPVSRATLRARLGHGDAEDENAAESSDGLNAVIYRLRKRIERATPLLVPLQSRSRVGYVFRAPLVRR